MGETITEKILAKAGDRDEVSPGEYVFLASPCPVPGIGRGGPPIEARGARFFDRNMVIIMDDHAGAGGFWDVMATEENRARLSKRVKALGIPRSNIFINKGIGHLLSAENCWALPGIKSRVNQGDELEIDLSTGVLKNLTTGEELSFPAYPDFLLEIIDAGGLYPLLREKLVKDEVPLYAQVPPPYTT